MTLPITKHVWISPLSASALIIGLGLLLSSGAPDAAPSRTLPILVYHQVLPTDDLPENGFDGISRERFEQQMRYLHDQGYTTLSMSDVVGFLRGEAIPAKSVAIHLDDGWKSHVEAAAVLTRFGMRASFWVIPGSGIGEPHMDWPDIAAIASEPRFEVFSHTMTHPWKPNDTMLDWLRGRTPQRDLARARWEIAESKRVLEERLGKAVPYLAWPSGHYDDTLIDIARSAGYGALLTIDEGLNVPGGDPLRIHRTLVHGGCDQRSFTRQLEDGRHRICD